MSLGTGRSSCAERPLPDGQLQRDTTARQAAHPRCPALQNNHRGDEHHAHAHHHGRPAAGLAARRHGPGRDLHERDGTTLSANIDGMAGASPRARTISARAAGSGARASSMACWRAPPAGGGELYGGLGAIAQRHLGRRRCRRLYRQPRARRRPGGCVRRLAQRRWRVRRPFGRQQFVLGDLAS